MTAAVSKPPRLRRLVARAVMIGKMQRDPSSIPIMQTVNARGLRVSRARAGRKAGEGAAEVGVDVEVGARFTVALMQEAGVEATHRSQSVGGRRSRLAAPCRACFTLQCENRSGKAASDRLGCSTLSKHHLIRRYC
jgi:hypothetical protein